MTAVAQLLDVLGALVNTASPPTLYDSNAGVLPKGYRFPQSSTAPIVLKARAEFFAGSTATLKLSWYSFAGSTTGNVTWSAEVAAVTPGDAVSVEAKGYATAQSATSAVNATAKGEQQTSITLVNLDSLAANDDLWIRISRTDASMAGDAVLFDAALVYDDGTTGGGGDVVGPAGVSSSYNLALFDGTTGKLLQDSGIAVTLVVRSPTGSTDNAVPRWDGIGGTTIQDSLVIVSDTGAVTGVTSLNGRTIANWVDGPASSTNGRVAVYNGTTGKLLQDGTKLEADLVTGPASSVGFNIARFAGTTGKVIADSGVDVTRVVTPLSTSTDNAIVRWDGITGNINVSIQTSAVVIDDSGNITGAGTLNTRTIANWVDGPASAISGQIATFNGTTGKLIQDSGLSASTVVQGPASAVDNNLASYNLTTGKFIKDSGVSAASVVVGPASAVSGNIVSYNGTTGKLVQDSGVSATAHAARHNVGGADTIFPGTWAAGDAAVWSGSAFVPKFNDVAEASANFSITAATQTFADVTGLTIALPRAGTYKLYASGLTTLTGTIGAGGSAYCFNYTGTVTRVAATGFVSASGTGLNCYLYIYQSANNAIATFTGSGTTASNQAWHLTGSITVSTTGTLSLRAARNGTPTATVLAGAALQVVEA